uniref:hypothetical protein n=1 Tax=Trametes maxima TaxID=259368 RepID=UPI003003181E|nr:hypothetical protein [Trametes maxima]
MAGDICLWYALVCMRNYTIIPNDSYFYLLHHILILIYKPFIIGPVLFLIFKKKCKLYFSVLDTLLILMLIYQVGLLIDIIINNFINYSTDIDLIFKMSGNTTGNNIPSSEGRNNDIARLIRYLSANVAALSARRPMSRAIGLTIANAGNILADIASDEARANCWIDRYNFYMANGRFRGGSGPFERDNNTFENPDNIGKSYTSNYLPDLSLFKDLFAPVEHSIPLDTLQNIHTIMTLGLFVLVFCTVLLLIYFFFNLLILFNKDFLLNRVENKYAVLYIKYVLFKSRVDILVIGLLIIGTLCFVLYILHYLIVHPVIVNT